MILTPEEQTEAREEIDYAIETHGYEYIWGKETTMDKTKGLLRDAPSKIIGAATGFVNNPTVIGINEKLKAHAQKINAQDNGRNEPMNQPRRNQQGKRRQQSKPEHPAWQRGFNLDSDDHL